MLIIIHDIAEHGPLCDRDKSGVPVDHLTWRTRNKKSDTPKHHYREDGKINCETLWVSSTKKGDYYDNMNSEMFMLFVQNKLIPYFEQQFPGKKRFL